MHSSWSGKWCVHFCSTGGGCWDSTSHRSPCVGSSPPCCWSPAACAHAAPAGVRLCLELLNRFEGYLVNTAEQTLSLIEQTGASNLAVAYDTHHAHIEERDIAASMAALGPRLAHTHISESHRGTLGTGLVDWAAVFGALKANDFAGWLMVEAFSTDVLDLADSAHVWRDNFTSKEEVARTGLPFMQEHWAAA